MELLTAADADARARNMAGSLLARGLEPGDRVAVCCTSSANMLALVIGALRRGIVPVLLNPGLLPAERDELVTDADVALVVGDGDLAGLVGGPAVELAPAPLARPMHYTSGTTGRPKGVWSGLLDEAEAARLAGEEAELWGFAADDLNLVCSPLHHSAPVRFAVGTLLAGGRVLVPPRFDARWAAEAIDRHRPSTAFMAPAHLQRLFASGERPSLRSFRLVAHAGSACPEPVKRAALAGFPTGSVWEFYGSTEGQFTACSPEEWEARPGTVGRARPGRHLSVDGDGTIWCRAPRYARFEYWRDPAKTAAGRRGDAFTVGDLGRLDDDGYLFIEARRDDLVISGGVNVYPAEVERVLGTMPGIKAVVVFGMEDPRWGQRVCAAVVGDTSPDAVIAFGRAHLAAYKCPKQVVLVDEIPVSPMGKVHRSTLGADLGLEGAPSGSVRRR